MRALLPLLLPLPACLMSSDYAPSPPPDIYEWDPYYGEEPGPDEVCNGLDDDGDGSVDEGVQFQRWPDADEDGYGDPSRPTWVCLDEDGYSDDPRDCDDDDPSRHPAGTLQLYDISEDARVDLPSSTVPSSSCPALQVGGVAAADLDGDGLPELFLPRVDDDDELLHNGDGNAFSIRPATNIGPGDGSLGALAFDAEGDGDLDLYVTTAGAEPARLYINDGAMTFTEEGVERGVSLPLSDAPACAGLTSASAADVDGDGDLDLHVAAWRSADSGTPVRSRLLLNGGAGTFSDATVTAGLDLDGIAATTSVLHDLDDDLDPDLVVAADGAAPMVFENDGAGRFSEVSDALPGAPPVTRGVAVGDIDGDGDPDLFLTGTSHDGTGCPDAPDCSGNRLFRNEGGLQFVDLTPAAGVGDGGYAWGAQLVDLDLDGWLDLVQAAGLDSTAHYTEPARLWRNDGDSTFTEGACAAGWVHGGRTRALIGLDSEGDGDLDLFATRDGARPRLWENRAPAPPHLVVEVRDDGPNPFGIGARIVVRAPDTTRTRWITAGTSWLASGPPEAWVGLPDGSPVDLEVTWPDGETRTWEAVSPWQRFVATRP